MSQNTSKSKFTYVNSQRQGHSDLVGGYSHQYGSYAASLSTVANNSNHDMNKSVAASQQGMYPNAGMPTSGQHHQTMGGPVPSPTTIMQTGQQMSRNPPITIPPSYFQRNNVPRSMPNMARNPLAPVVNQPGQQPSSQFSHMSMVQQAFHPPLPLVVNQFPQSMYPQRHYTPQQYPAMISPGQHLFVNSYNFNTPPPQNSNGYYPTHGMSSYQSIQPQMAPQTIPPPQQQQPPQHRKGGKAIPIIDPNTGKNILTTEKNTDESNVRPNVEKENEKNDKSIGVQFASQVAAVLNDNSNEQPSKPQAESIRITESLNISSEKETMMNEEPPVSELVDELANIEDLSEIELIENQHNTFNDTSIVYYRKDIEENVKEHIDNSTSYQKVDTECVIQDNEQIADTVLDEPSQLDIDEIKTVIDTQKFESNILLQKSIKTAEITSKEQLFIESDSPSITNETVQSDTTAANLNKEEILDRNSNKHTVEEISTNLKVQASNESKKNKTKKKKDYNKRVESKEGGEMDAFLDTKEAGTVSSVHPSPAPVVPAATPSVPTPENLFAPVTITDAEFLKNIPLPGEILEDVQNDVSPSEPSSDASSVSPNTDNEDNKENTEAQNKITLKYTYKEDQWSPLNPEGKKQYDRDFLLQLQSQPMSLCKPNNLPNLDVIKDKAQIQRLTEMNRMPPPMITPIRAYNDPFVPQYARANTGPRIPHAPVNRRSQGRGGEKTRKVISFSSLNQNVKLHESQNAWKPLHKAEGPADAPTEQVELDKLKRNIQGVLNKLTPQKFETLVGQVKNLNIDNEEKLSLVIDLVFEKAVDEPNFSVPYANLCKHLALIKVPVAGSSSHVNFRKLLLTKCQKEFEVDRTDTDPKKGVKVEIDEEEEKKIRYRQLGNIRFIGELFKLSMLIEPIMHECIKKLLIQGDDESLECLCKLLKTIGKELDDGKSGKSREESKMDVYFNEMKSIVDKRLTSSRVRFMLQDVIDLKKNNWIPRRDENNPKTIDQIHKEAEREAREQQQVFQNINNYTKRMPDERDRRKNTSRMGQSEDGWTSSSKSNKGSYSMVDPSKLKLTKPDEVESIRLGPGGRGLQSWGRGSSGGTKTSVDSDVKTTLTNRFNALAETNIASNYEGRRGSQRSAASSRESSRGRNNQLPPAIRKTPSTSKERENLLETVKGLTRAAEVKVPENKKTDSHLNGKITESEDLCLKSPEYNEDNMDKKTQPLIDEFLHNNDFEEAVKRVTELTSSNTVHMFINAAVNQVLERSSQARFSLGQLLYSLLKKKIITFDQYKKGFKSVLEIIDEYALDIPLIWDYMGEILRPMIEDTEFSLKLIKDVLKPCIPSQTAGMLVSAILHYAAKKRGTIKLGEVWRESGLQWSDFLGKDINIPEFIKKHKLEFTVSPTKVKPRTQMSIEELRKNLLSPFKRTENLVEMFDWIYANVSDLTELSFIRAFVTAVHESAILNDEGSYKLDQNKLKTMAPLLTHYIGRNEKLGLQALYAVQALMNELGHPSGLLHQIFDILYYDDVITEETFKDWEQSDDPDEAEGKGVAIHSVKSFLVWLKEPEE